uniref:Uncharacterized protein n=1 Tax=Arundo donax TaxID=35708 RepID=A0A0A9DAF9_ARUDO
MISCMDFTSDLLMTASKIVSIRGISRLCEFSSCFMAALILTCNDSTNNIRLETAIASRPFITAPPETQ